MLKRSTPAFRTGLVWAGILLLTGLSACVTPSAERGEMPLVAEAGFVPGSRLAYPAQPDEDFKPFPDILVRDADGEFDTTRYRGKVMAVHFLGLTWCEPCHREVPAIAKAYEMLRGDDRIAILLIAVSVGDEKGRAWLKRSGYERLPLLNTGYPYRRVDGRPASFVALTGLGYVPSTVIVDRNGAMLIRRGFIKDGPAFATLLRRIADEAAPHRPSSNTVAKANGG